VLLTCLLVVVVTVLAGWVFAAFGNYGVMETVGAVVFPFGASIYGLGWLRWRARRQQG
jgi:hypothetical protein